MAGRWRSLLSSTDSCWNPLESSQFPEFWRKNEEERNPRCPNRTSAFADVWFGCRSTHQPLHPQPPPSSTMPPHCFLITPATSSSPHHRSSLSPSPLAASTHICPLQTTMTWRCHVINGTSTGHLNRPNDNGFQGAMSLSATWQPNDEWRWCRHSSLLI